MNSSFKHNITLPQNLSSTTPENAQNISETLRLGILIICILVIALGVSGNGLVLLVFGLRLSKLKSCEIFMISLALADFFNAVVAPVRNILELTGFNFGLIGNSGCKLISFLSTTTMTVSALTLLAVSIDRFIVVKWPLHRRPYPRTLLTIIACTWVVAGALGSIYLIGKRIRLNENLICSNYMNSEEYVIFAISTFLIQSVIPIIIMTVLYSLIVFELRKSAKSGIFAHCQREMAIRLSQNRKANKMVFLVVMIFYVCILPSNLFFLWYIFSHAALKKAKIIYDILSMLQMCNSIANPIIYSRLHTSFQREIIRLICPWCYDKSLSRCKSVQDTIRCSVLYNSSFHLKNRSDSRTSNGSSIKTRISSITSLQLLKKRATDEEVKKLSGLWENEYPPEIAAVERDEHQLNGLKKYSRHLLHRRSTNDDPILMKKLDSLSNK